MPPHAAWKSKIRPFLAALLPPLMVAAVAAGVGAVTLKGDFVWDDRVFIVMNRAYWRFDLRQMLFSPANGVEYLPVRDLSLAFDFLLWRGMPWGFHLTNVLLYALNVVAVFLIARDIPPLVEGGAKPERAFVVSATAAAALFAVHPLHSEAVSFITCRNLLLCGLFFFLSFRFWLQRLQTRGGIAAAWYLLALVAFVLAMFSKASGVVLPLLMILPVVLGPQPRPAALRRFLEIIPFAVVAAATTVLFISIGRTSNIVGAVPDTPLREKLAVALQIPFFYLAKLVAPVGLCPEYDVVFSRELTSLRTLGALLALTALLAAAIVIRRKLPLATFCIAWFLLGLLPHLNLLPTTPEIADRYAYLSSFAFCLFAGRAWAAAAFRHIRPATAAAALIITVTGTLAVRQNLVWRTEKSLWAHNIEVAPGSLKPYNELARILFDEKRYQQALELAARAQRIDPASPEYDFMLGRLLLLQDNPAAAIEPLRVAVNRDPFFLEGFYQLGKTYERLGRRGEALATYNRLLVSGGVDMGGYRELARQAVQLAGQQAP